MCVSSKIVHGWFSAVLVSSKTAAAAACSGRGDMSDGEETDKCNSPCFRAVSVFAVWELARCWSTNIDYLYFRR